MTRRVLITGGSGFIGTNLVEACLARGDEVVNLDIAAPRDPAQGHVWQRANLTDRADVARVVAEADPTHVVHLGARTDLGGSGMVDYAANVEGTRALLAALSGQHALKRLVVASSMLVCRNGYVPTSDTDYCPTTAYGRSKQQVELDVRSWPGPERPADGAGKSGVTGSVPWVIVRPASIWGPWFGEPYRDFFEAVRRRRYVHPGRRRITKALGYVGNSVVQIQALLDDRTGALDGSTVYLCDNPPHTVGEWADEVARAWGVRLPPTVPVPVLRAGAMVGDLLGRTGVMASPPLTTFRLENMLTGSRFDTTWLDSLTGPLPFTMGEGVAETVAWMRAQGRR